MNTVDLATVRSQAASREHKIGRFTLQPYRQLLGPHGPVPVKPKALAILSVLAEADGTLVTKDELMATVWPNIIVEDNAIQAHVASLRKALGQDSELLCTVHGLGYRLVAAGGGAPGESEAGQPTAPIARPSGLVLLFALLLVASAALAGMWLLGKNTKAAAGQPAQVAIMPFDLSGSDPATAVFANDLRDRISADLSGAQILNVTRDKSKGLVEWAGRQADPQLGAEFLLGARIASDGGTLDIHVQLRDGKEGVTVWSATFRNNRDGKSALLASVSTAVADAVHFAVIGRTGKVRLNATGVAALVEARESMTTVSRPNPLLQMAAYRKVLDAAPDFSWGHSGLAVADAFQLRAEPGNVQLRAEAKREALRALELQPANGEAYIALEMILPRFAWREREAILLKGIKADPGFSPAAVMEGRLRLAVGRSRDALFWFKRVYAIDPLHNNNTFTYAASLLSEGFATDSQKLLAQMDAQWPDHIATRNAHFWTSVIAGTVDQTIAILSDASKWPIGMNQKAADAWIATLAAQKSNQAAARQQAATAVNNAAAEGPLSHGDALLLLSMLDDVDGAFAQAEAYLPSDPQWGPLLFLGPTLKMRKDPRFMALAVKFGFAAYWRSTGQWPDFCGAKTLPYDCKTELNKLAGKNPALAAMPDIRPAVIPY